MQRQHPSKKEYGERKANGTEKTSPLEVEGRKTVVEKKVSKSQSNLKHSNKQPTKNIKAPKPK